MKKIIKSQLWVALLLSAGTAMSQKLQTSEVVLPTSKDASKKGMYVNTTLTKDNTINTFVAYDLKKGELGFDVATVDLSGKLLSNASEVASTATAQKYGITIPNPDMVENPAKGKTVLRLVTANGVLGKLKVEEGTFEPKYATSADYGANVITYTKVLRGFKFLPGKSYDSDMRLNIFAAHTTPENDIERTFNIIEGYIPNTVAYLPSTGVISFLGKDARFDKNSPNAHNVLISGQFDGKTKSFTNVVEHVLEYNVVNVTSGTAADGNKAVLVSALNAPTTIGAHKKWQADGTPYMTFITFDTQGKVKENVTFKSKSIRGNFGVTGFDGANYVVSLVNGEHDGYYRADIGKATDIQIVKIQNGSVAAQEVISLDDAEKLVITPGGKAGKLKIKSVNFISYEKAPNGDILAYSSAGSEYAVFQFDTNAKLKAIYSIERVPGKELFESGIQSIAIGSDLYMLFREQSGAIAQGVSKSYSRSGVGYMKNVNFSRNDELMTYGRIVKLNAESKSLSEPVDVADDVILGESPLIMGANGLLLVPTRSSKGSYKMLAIK